MTYILGLVVYAVFMSCARLCDEGQKNKILQNISCFLASEFVGRCHIGRIYSF